MIAPTYRDELAREILLAMIRAGAWNASAPKWSVHRAYEHAEALIAEGARRAAAAMGVQHG